jgi:hypothetical protein
VEKHYLDCQCDCNEHVLRFVMDPGDGELWLETYLSQYHTWYERVWIALKYVFGHQSSYGAFDCTLLKPEDYGRLASLLARSADVKDHQTVTEFTVSLPEKGPFKV